MLEPLDLPRFLVGSLLYLLPGWTWTWALLPERHPLHRIPVAIVVAFTLQPAVLFVLHLAAGLPLSGLNVALLSAALAAAGVALRFARQPAPWSLDRLDEAASTPAPDEPPRTGNRRRAEP